MAINRKEFLKSLGGLAALTIIPRRVLGGFLVLLSIMILFNFVSLCVTRKINSPFSNNSLK